MWVYLRRPPIQLPLNVARAALFLAAALYIAAGILHFLRSEPYLRIMPLYLPWHSALVYISGFFEIIGGIGLLIPQTRRNAAWGLVILLIAVFPANIYMATDPVETGSVSIPVALRWGRLPVQFLLIWCLLWCTQPRKCR